MLAPPLVALRLTLHVLAATVWVGGQLVMLGLVPTAKRLGEGAPRELARAFARLSWPAFAVLVATGIWNVSASHLDRRTSAWKVVLGVKIAVVAVAGASAMAHTRARSKTALAIWGSVAGVTSIAALVLGVLLAT